MRHWIALLLASTVVPACVAPEARSGPPPAAAPDGPLPAGLYEVHETVLVDTCRPSHALEPRVTVMKRSSAGSQRLVVPVPAFGIDGKPTERVDVHPEGFKGSGMAHPKQCPGLQQEYRHELVGSTPTSFQLRVDYEVADAWDCPGARPGPTCRTSLVYEYRLLQAACPSRCDATVPGVRDADVPVGPTELTCSCG